MVLTVIISILIALACLYVVMALWFHFANPYARVTITKKPYKAFIAPNGNIDYTEHFRLTIKSDRFWDLLGYLRQGYLIIESRYLVDTHIYEKDISKIIARIHALRFTPNRPYLISGDQFSVLYPRNLGVFYNQLLNPRTALSQTDWQNRQLIYLQSALYAIDGLAANPTATTIIPLGGKVATATHVHPHDLGSDAVYGLLYALHRMTQTDSYGDYSLQTQAATQKVLQERQNDLQHIVATYIASVENPITRLIDPDIAVASARDGATRHSSFYDNVILWKTRELASELGIVPCSKNELQKLHDQIDDLFWLPNKHHYANDTTDETFSGDWLIGYVTGFFNLNNPVDLQRTEQIIAYIRNHKIAEPFPLKYQVGLAKEMPFFIRLFLPSYGSNAIWSYWGAQYITLLMDVYGKTKDESYVKDAEKYLERYERTMVRDHGYAETFSPKGKFLVSPIYRSIRITGWVVQHEYAAWLFKQK